MVYVVLFYSCATAEAELSARGRSVRNVLEAQGQHNLFAYITPLEDKVIRDQYDWSNNDCALGKIDSRGQVVQRHVVRAEIEYTIDGALRVCPIFGNRKPVTFVYKYL